MISLPGHQEDESDVTLNQIVPSSNLLCNSVFYHSDSPKNACWSATGMFGNLYLHAEYVACNLKPNSVLGAKLHY